jgi:acyl-CoA synthetase (NDP forming)
MQFALADSSTRVIGLFLETVRDPETFRRALEEARDRDVPVVVLKTGRSERGAQMARAHSGALAGRDAAYDALFERYGVCRCASIDEMMDSLELFAAGVRPRTAQVAALHDSGGQRALLVDLAESLGVEFASIGPETTRRLEAVLEPGLEAINPLDAWGTGNGAEGIYEECLRALDADPATGLTVFACDLYPSDEADFFYPEIVRATLDALQNPLVWLVHLSASTSRPQAEALRAMGIPVLMGTETGLRAIAHAVGYARLQRRMREQTRVQARAVPRPPGLAALRAELEAAPGPLDESASKRFLRAYGLATPREVRVDSEAEAEKAGTEIGYPLVLKTAAGDLHKTERGGVRLGIRNREELLSAYRDFEARLGALALVQEEVPDAADLFLGLVNDEQFGPLLSVGSGGIFVEVLNDVRLLSLPTSGDRIRETLLGLRGAALLQGARGRAPADLEAVVNAGLALAALAEDLGDLIAELDINPLRVSSEGARVLDALIVPRIR